MWGPGLATTYKKLCCCTQLGWSPQDHRLLVCLYLLLLSLLSWQKGHGYPVLKMQVNDGGDPKDGPGHAGVTGCPRAGKEQQLPMLQSTTDNRSETACSVFHWEKAAILLQLLWNHLPPVTDVCFPSQVKWIEWAEKAALLGQMLPWIRSIEEGMRRKCERDKMG